VHDAGIDEPLVWYDGAALTDRRHLHADERGSIIATSNSSAVATIYKYGPYGEPDTWTGPRFKYTGQAALPEAGLYHYKARVYDPVLGRFLQTDPVGYTDDFNLYAYVGNEPTGSTDPTGTRALIALRAYELGNAPIVGRYGHAYLLITDLDTGITYVSRAGPSAEYPGRSSAAAVNRSYKNVTVFADLTTFAESSELREMQQHGISDEVVDTFIDPREIAEVLQDFGEYNQNVNDAEIPYRPRSTNSNSYATSSFEEVTGQEVKGEQWLPGSEDTLPVKKPDTNQELNRQNRRVVPCNGGSAYVRCSNGVAAWWE
jgi:RHS repeat-associated protein